MKILTVYGTPQNSGNIFRVRNINNELKKLGNEITEIPPVRRMPLQLNFLYSIPAYFPYVFNDTYDIVFASKPYLNATIIAFLKKLQDSKIVADIDDLTFMYHERGAMRLILKFFEDILPKYFDLVCVHSKNIGNYMLNHGIKQEKLCYLPNGVNLSIFNPKLYDKNIYRKKLGLRQEKIILYLANLDISSELDTILKALKDIIKSNNVKFVIVGTGVLENYYKNIVTKMGLKKNVIFTGYVPSKDVPGYIYAADCCVVYYSNKLANHYRTCLKIREYLAMGKAVVCNDLGDLSNFKDYTFNFQTENFKQFNDNILQVLNNDIDTKKVIEGQQYIKRNFSWEKIVAEFNKTLINRLGK